MLTSVPDKQLKFKDLEMRMIIPYGPTFSLVISVAYEVYIV